MDDADSLRLSVDGVDLISANSTEDVDRIESEHRVYSGVFSLDLVDNNWIGDPAGTYDDSLVDGYFAALRLPVGVHTVTYGGGISSLGFSNSVVARIEVAPIPVPIPLALLIAGLAGLAGVAQGRAKP